MVIIERQKDRTYRLHGRSLAERATVPFWPCPAFMIKQGAVPNAPTAWLKEAAKVVRDAAQAENNRWGITNVFVCSTASSRARTP